MNNRIRAQWRLSRMACFVATQVALMSGTIMNAHARDYFDPALLEIGAPEQKAIDLSSFEERGGQMPGSYRVDVFLNNEKMETRNVDFRMEKDAKGEEILQPCIPVDDLNAWGVLTEKFPALGAPGSACANLAAIPQASSDFHFAELKLLLSFPQSAVNNSARGWVDPKYWDEGIPAMLLNYSASGASNRAKNGNGNNSSSQYVNLRPGINIGPWRLRNYTTWNRSQNSGPNGEAKQQWDTIYTYAQRNIVALRSQLLVGDSSTPADVFESIPFRGAQLASDDDMLPESLRGYAPVVRGIARTNAQVTIRQNGYVIYQTYVSPGSFEITDMYPTGGAGNLNVTIKESDGSEQLLVIPFASLPVLQREGRLKYAVTAGVYRSYDSSVDKTMLAEGTAIYGLPAGFTAYGGGQMSHNYQSLALGLGKNLGDFGAASVDVTQAWSQQKNLDKESGQAWRARYSKNFVQTGTNFAVAGYRYATSGYWSMNEVLDTYTSGNSYPLQERRRNRAELTLGQDLWEGGGNLGVTIAREDYWHTARRMNSYTLSYNNSWNGISYGINYTYNRSSQAAYDSNSGRIYDKEQLVAFNLNIPLNTLLGSKRPISASYMLNSSRKGQTSNSVSISGSALEDNNLTWSVQQGYGSRGQGNSGSTNTSWRASSGEINGGYAYDNHSQRLNYGIQGGIVAHENGVTLSQPLGETLVLVAAPGAKSVAVQGQNGVKTDYRGYTVVPYASPYRKNEMTLNTETFDDNTEVAITTQTVVPTRGAVVKATYQTSVGHRVLMTLLRAGGLPVPFGAMVTSVGSKDTQSFIVGDAGQVYLTGMAPSGQLKVQWGSAANEQCHVNYTLSGETQGVINAHGLCQ